MGLMQWRAAFNQVYEQVFPHEDCPECKGTGVDPHGVLKPYQCDRCNGTGIKGNPITALVIMMVVFLLTVLLPLWLWLR
jgi:DnaJ-class molecular chaperone